MAQQLYALKQDVDMIAEQVQTLTMSLTTLDWIAQKVKKLEEELTCQGEQMRRIEKTLVELVGMKGEMQTMNDEMQGMKKTLALIVKHLGIKNA